MHKIKYAVRLTLVAIASIAIVPADASDTQAACQDLASIALPGRQILSAKMVPAGAFETPDGLSYKAPAFCRIQGVAKPTSDSEIHFELWLPSPKDWNGCYYQHG